MKRFYCIHKYRNAYIYIFIYCTLLLVRRLENNETAVFSLIIKIIFKNSKFPLIKMNLELIEIYIFFF